MTAVHIGLGIALVAVNAGAGLYGAWAWWRWHAAPGFWPLLRMGQALVALTAAIGGVLSLTGQELPPLHLVYGLTPLGVSFLAEQLRVVSAQAVLDARAIPSAQAVGELTPAEQRSVVVAILRREMGVMAASALVVAALAIRASGLI